MVEGVGTFRPAEQQSLLTEMADTVAQSADPDLMRAVADLGQGALTRRT
jgi:hypothetical protein